MFVADLEQKTQRFFPEKERVSEFQRKGLGLFLINFKRTYKIMQNKQNLRVINAPVQRPYHHASQQSDVQMWLLTGKQVFILFILWILETSDNDGEHDQGRWQGEEESQVPHFPLS